jgi:hypothetical protein
MRFDGLCWGGCQRVRFGAVPMPEGYEVWWHEEHEHYQAHGPGEWESVITCDRWQARRWAVQRAAEVPQ